MSESDGLRIGPVRLAPGITRINFWAYMYASFITIGILAGMNFLQPYVLTETLNIPASEQGTISGNLGTWQEIIILLLINPCGWIADRIGRRPVMIFGIVVCGLGYGMYPYAETVAELTAYRLFFAVGAAALAAIIAVVANDYPHEKSRGKLIGFGNVMNGLGVLFMTAAVAQIPDILTGRGVEAETAGLAMFLFVCGLCLMSGLIFQLGLKGGLPDDSKQPASWGSLMTSGFRAATNPRVTLSYAAAFVGRADNSIKGAFVSLWVVNVGTAAGMSAGEAIGRAGLLFGTMSLMSMVWVGIFGFILDRVNRVTGLGIAMGLAGFGYTSMWFITSPLDLAMLPAFLLMAIGQTSVICASVTLIGQEALTKERGAVIAMNGFFGAIGIMVAFAVGGRLFDSWAPYGPFVMIGLLQLVLCVLAFVVRLASPGQARSAAQAA